MFGKSLLQKLSKKPLQSIDLNRAEIDPINDEELVERIQSIKKEIVEIHKKTSLFQIVCDNELRMKYLAQIHNNDSLQEKIREADAEIQALNQRIDELDEKMRKMAEIRLQKFQTVRNRIQKFRTILECSDGEELSILLRKYSDEIDDD